MGPVWGTPCPPGSPPFPHTPWFVRWHGVSSQRGHTLVHQLTRVQGIPLTLGVGSHWPSPSRGGRLSCCSEDRGDSASSELGPLPRLAPPTPGAVGASCAQGRRERLGGGDETTLWTGKRKVALPCLGATWLGWLRGAMPFWLRVASSQEPHLHPTSQRNPGCPGGRKTLWLALCVPWG